MSTDLAPEIEAGSLRAWPGAEEARLGAWHLRATGGYTRRANSANPLGDPGVALPRAVAHVEAWFRPRNVTPVFKMTAAACPSDLDAHLDAAGWERQAPSRVMTAGLTDVASAALPPGFALHLDAEPPVDWLDAFARWNGLSVAAAACHRQIISRIQPARALARVLGPDAVTRSVGLAVADGRWVGLFDLVTDPEYRGRGIGRAVVADLVAWGAAQGAGAAYLQVTERNEAAYRLYGRLGFRTAYAYWYRVAPESG